MKNAYWYAIVIGLIIIAFGMTTVVWVTKVPLFYSNPINTTYETITHTHGQLVKEIAQDFQLPWQIPTASNQEFNSISASPAAQAFAAGIWSGQQKLLGNENPKLPQLLSPSNQQSWLKTQWQRDFDLGQWVFLLWTITQFTSPQSVAFWDKQQQILVHFQADFDTTVLKSSEEEQPVLFALELIKPIIEKLPIESKPQLYDQLGSELAFMMDSLSP